jgi:hypothetical protein
MRVGRGKDGARSGTWASLEDLTAGACSCRELLAHLRQALLADCCRQARIVDDRLGGINALAPMELLGVVIARGEPEDALVELENGARWILGVDPTVEDVEEKFAGEEDR